MASIGYFHVCQQSVCCQTIRQIVRPGKHARPILSHPHRFLKKNCGRQRTILRPLGAPDPGLIASSAEAFQDYLGARRRRLNRDWRKDPKTWEKLGNNDLFSIESRATSIIAREALGAVLAGDDVWSSRWGGSGPKRGTASGKQRLGDHF